VSAWFAAPGPARPPAVAGAFYPGDRGTLQRMVEGLLHEAARRAAQGEPRQAGAPARSTEVAGSPRGIAEQRPLGVLVPHAGLVYSGLVAAAAWRLLETPPTGGPPVASTEPAGPMTVVILGTNHRAGWLDAIGAWDDGVWQTPLGDVEVDSECAAAILRLGRPFTIDRRAHLDEHSIEVQLPLLRTVVPDARIVPLAVALGTGAAAADAGVRLGARLAERRTAGDRLVLAISSDMAHYPPVGACEGITAALLPSILALDAPGLAAREASIRDVGLEGVGCGMCGIEPAVVGLAALRAMGATTAVALASATSADAGGPPDRTVGYLAVRFDA
jgi:AmmeMemoRadiSam system protein B